MFIDTHCHLMFKEYDEDRAMVIGNAKKAGVKKFIIPGVDFHSSTQAVELAGSSPEYLFASIGFHPYEAQNEEDTSLLVSFFSSKYKKNIVAIGECGLDYHLYKGEVAQGKKDKQKILFEQQLQLALQYNLPVIMHCRDAYEDFFSVLDSMPTMPRGVIHCFSGGLQEIRMATDRKLSMGVDGNSTYSKQLQSIIPSLPITSLLLETDAPYLTPMPHRGTRNEPKYIPIIAQTVAKLQGISVDQVESITTRNADSLFPFA